jgi:hypothetical protein
VITSFAPPITHRYLIGKDLAAAEESFKKAVSLDRKSTSALMALDAFYERQKRWFDAPDRGGFTSRLNRWSSTSNRMPRQRAFVVLATPAIIFFRFNAFFESEIR